MKVRKLISLSLSVALSFSIFSCGGGGSNTETSTTSSISEEQIVAESPIVENLKVGDTEALLSPTSNQTVLENDYAVTSTDIGIIAPIKFETLENRNDTLADENTTIDEVLNTTISSSSNTPYVITSLRPIKKPITTQDGKLAVLLDFQPTLPSGMDMSVGIVNYKSLLALPDNGYQILKSGYIPLPDFSGDIGFFDTNRNRIWDINNKLLESNVTLNVYTLIPYSDEANQTFSEGGNYTIFVYNPDTNTFSNETVKIEPKTSATSIETTLKGAYPFVLAKKASEGEVVEVNGTLNIPYEGVILKGGIIFTNNDGKVIGIAKINSNNTYTGYYVSSWLSNNQTCPNVTVTSLLLKEGKFNVPSFDCENPNIDIPEDAFSANYPVIFKLNDTDKAILNDIIGYEGYELPKPYTDDLNDALHPENTFCTSDSYASYPQGLCEDFSNLITAFLNGEPVNSDMLKDFYNDTENCTIISKNITNDTISISLKCTYLYSYNDTDYNSSYTSISNEEGTYTISKNEDNTYNVSWEYSSNGKYEYYYNDTLEEDNSWTDSGSGKYKLQINNGIRTVYNYQESGKTTYSEKENGGEQQSTYVTWNENYIYKGDNKYLGYGTYSFKKTKTGENYSYTYSDNVKSTLPIAVENNTANVDGEQVVVITNLQFSSNPSLNATLNSNSILILTSPNGYSWYLNTGSEEVTNIVSGYDLEDILEELANGTNQQ